MLSVLSKTLPQPHLCPTDDSDWSDDDSRASSSTSASSVDSLPMERTSIEPATWIYIPFSQASSEVMKKLFSKHAKENIVGICLAANEVATIKNMQADVLGDIQYFTSPKIDVDFAHNMAFFEAPASHLNTFAVAGLRPIIGRTDPSSKLFTSYIVECPTVVFPPVTSITYVSATPSSHCVNPANIPTLEEWKTIWTTWDMITLKMIPGHMLHQKPIDLRHKCLFYIGHIPTFLDMLLSKAVGGGPTEPKHFWNIFERGIDPHVDDPDHCHNHSEVPEKDEEWPVIETIMSFRDGVRARLMKLYDELKTGKRVLTRNIARTLLMTLEHEGFHIETLLYMLIQRAGTGTLPPPGFTVPPWELLGQQWNKTPVPSTSSVVVGPSTLVMGHEDSEADDFDPRFEHAVDDHEFGWDNENPTRRIEVGAFRAEWAPVSNKEFLDFLQGEGKELVSMPRSWESESAVKSMYGPVPMKVAQNWPVLTAYDDLVIYARCKGGRLPTEPELRLLLNKYDVGFEGGNVGFRNWHPVPATMGLSEDGRGTNGGVWEWTSTVFDNHDGLVPTNLFTGYSVDFFDTKHQVVLGASYVTIPRLCRTTVRNFYQHNYPYAWVAGRVVYDL